MRFNSVGGLCFCFLRSFEYYGHNWIDVHGPHVYWPLLGTKGLFIWARSTGLGSVHHSFHRKIFDVFLSEAGSRFLRPRSRQPGWKSFSYEHSGSVPGWNFQYEHETKFWSADQPVTGLIWRGPQFKSVRFRRGLSNPAVLERRFIVN